jgi:O-antigen/teichoic acid export membrane protein
MIKKNLIANYLGQGWVALMGLAFIPFYIKFLGIEAYGLIGLFAVLLSWLALLDMGMTPTLGREMARFTGGGRNVVSVRDLLRSIEIVAFVVAVLISCVVALGADWIADNWLNSDSVPTQTVANAFVIMGIVASIRFIEGVYRSAIIGMQKQVLFNKINATMATIRGLGAIIILKWVSATILAFFFWQGLLSILTLIILRIVTYNCLPKGKRKGRFSILELKGISQFASGMIGITLLKVMLTQIDKVILSKFLTLTEFGYYTLATTVASSLLILASPIIQAFYPKFCELHARNDTKLLIDSFHKSSRLVSILAGSFCITMIFFSQAFLELWTQDVALASKVSYLLMILSIGSLINGLMWIPYQIQLAHQWTKLSFGMNLVSVIVLVPAIILVVPEYGAIGAAWIWVILNCGYFFISTSIMHRKILITEKWNWYIKDVFYPLILAIVAIMFIKIIFPNPLSIISQLTALSMAVIIAIIASGATSKFIRDEFLTIFFDTIKKLSQSKYIS